MPSVMRMSNDDEGEVLFVGGRAGRLVRCDAIEPGTYPFEPCRSLHHLYLVWAVAVLPIPVEVVMGGRRLRMRVTRLTPTEISLKLPLFRGRRRHI